MNSKEAIKHIMKQNKVTQTWMAEQMGYPRQSNVSATLSNKSSISMKIFLRMVELVGYEVVIQPKKRGRRPEGQIVIDQEE